MTSCGDPEEFAQMEFVNVDNTDEVEHIEAIIRRHLLSLGIHASLRYTESDARQPASIKLNGESIEIEKLRAFSEQDLSELLRLRLARLAGLRTILFVCTGNAIRSQIAEGIVNHFFADKWVAFSAGTMPLGVQKDTIAVMREIDIDLTGHYAKHVDLFKECNFDQVVILCSDAGKRCPVFMYAGNTDQMVFDDPLSPDILAGAIFFSYRSQLRSLRKQMKKTISAYLTCRE